jgi:hypothetical protein
MGPIQAVGSQSIVVNAIGLVPGTVYVVTFTADLVPETSAVGTPAAASTTVTLSPQVSQIFKQAYPTGVIPAPIIVTPVPGAAYVSINLTPQDALDPYFSPQVVGVQSGIAYDTANRIGLQGEITVSLVNTTSWVVQINTTIDQQYQLFIDGDPGVPCVVTVDCDNTPFPTLYRPDGRTYPQNDLCVSLAGSAFPGTLAPAPGFHRCILIGSASLAGIQNASNPVYVIQYTNHGVTNSLLTTIGVTNSSTGVVSLSWPAGVLCDPNTAVVLTATSAGFAAATLTYDIVT